MLVVPGRLAAFSCYCRFCSSVVWHLACSFWFGILVSSYFEVLLIHLNSRAMRCCFIPMARLGGVGMAVGAGNSTFLEPI